MNATATAADLLSARRVALIGASRRSPWTGLILGNLERSAVSPQLDLIVRDSSAWGSVEADCHDDVSSLSGFVDVAYVLSSADRAIEAVRALPEDKVGTVIVLASGFAEDGDDGVERQRALVDACDRRRIRLLGPNSIGFFDVRGGVNLLASALPSIPHVGDVALVSQSGGIVRAVVNQMCAGGVGASVLVSTGNEATLGVAELVGSIIDRGDTTVVCLYLESIRDPERLAIEARRAAAAGIALVALRVGRSERGRRLAQAHTGALATDDAVTAGYLAQLGVVEVDSIEELVAVGGHLARGSSAAESPIFLAGSGGRCNLIADAAERVGLELADLPGEPEAGSLVNPVDVTGRFVTDATVLPRAAERALRGGRRDIVLAIDPPDDPHSAIGRCLAEGIMAVRQRVLDSGAGLHLMSAVSAPLTAAQLEYAEELGLAPVLPGSALGMRALQAAEWWSRHRRRVAEWRPKATREPGRRAAGALSEYEARLVVAELGGPPMVPAVRVTDVDEAIGAGKDINGRVVMKVSSASIPHKRAVGALEVDVADDEIGAAYERIMTAASRAVGRDAIDGVLISPMRSVRHELLVGGLRHPEFGPMVALHVGGGDVENATGDPCWRRLPASSLDIEHLIEEFSERGCLPRSLREALSRTDVGQAVAAAADALSGLFASGYTAAEFNPIAISDDAVEALDIWVEA